MAEVYFYIPADQTSNAVECGIKLSEWYSREIEIDGETSRFITALLNPRDDYEKYLSANFKCLKLEVRPKYCRIADSLLYTAGLAFPAVMELYRRSIIPIDRYAFGDYRLPEVLISSTIIGDQISVPGRGLDSPVLYNNSQELYFSNLMESLKDTHEDMNDTLLYLLFKRLCEEGKAQGIEDKSSGLAVFTTENDGRAITLRIPDFGGY